MKKGPGQGVVGQNVKFLCQNLSWDSAQATGVVRLTPNFVDRPDADAKTPVVALKVSINLLLDAAPCKDVHLEGVV